MIDWSIEAVSFGNCNCDYFCPCQFERRPNQGHCRGFEVGRIDRGHFGDTKLDGLCYALLYAWPGAVYEGSGTMQAVIDARRRGAAASARDRAAWRRDPRGQDPLVDFSRHVDNGARADFRADPVRRRYRGAHRASLNPRRFDIEWPADRQPGNRRRAPGSHRHPKRHRIRDCRNRQRVYKRNRPDPARSRRHLRPIQSRASFRYGCYPPRSPPAVTRGQAG